MGTAIRPPSFSKRPETVDQNRERESIAANVTTMLSRFYHDVSCRTHLFQNISDFIVNRLHLRDRSFDGSTVG